MAGVRQFINVLPAAGIPTTAAFSHNVNTGTRLVAVFFSSVTSESVSSLSDTLGNTWTERADVTVGAFRFEVWDAPSGSSGANTVSITFSAFTSLSKRVWLAEIAYVGTLSFGSSASFDQTVAQDPMTLATLTATDDGVAFVVLGTDTTYTFSSWDGPHFWQDMAGGGSSRAAYKIVVNGESLAPTLNATTTESGESLIAVYYDAASVGGSGETAYVFVG